MPVTQQIKVLRGTMLKMLVSWEYPSDPSITLDTIDFSVEYYVSPRKKVTLKKEDLYREEIIPEEGEPVVNYYAYVPTGDFVAGNLISRIYTEIPDEHAPEGVRPENSQFVTNVHIYA